MSAYIFEGEDTAAVKNRALAFAKRLNCGAAGENACGHYDLDYDVESGACCSPQKCLSCRTFESGNHPDTIFVRGTKQSGIGVDDVREQIVIPMASKPFKYKHKVFITERADTLTPAAQNALLKTIEEPAPYGVFLFLAANTFNFLPTVISRCVVKKIRGSAAAGNSDLRKLAEEITAACETADIPEAFALYRKIEPIFKENKNALQEFLNTLYVLCGEKKNFAAADAIIQTKKILSQNGNTQLAIELLLLKMRNSIEVFM